mmetsp:Transcript_16963/g.46954  ORF Transcript_16963/g.46954 Transcript_16963/m.46954 type:complete len:346 (-) Transcript_16963:290-1327(-)
MMRWIRSLTHHATNTTSEGIFYHFLTNGDVVSRRCLASCVGVVASPHKPTTPLMSPINNRSAADQRSRTKKPSAKRSIPVYNHNHNHIRKRSTRAKLILHRTIPLHSSLYVNSSRTSTDKHKINRKRNSKRKPMNDSNTTMSIAFDFCDDRSRRLDCKDDGFRYPRRNLQDESSAMNPLAKVDCTAATIHQEPLEFGKNDIGELESSKISLRYSWAPLTNTKKHTKPMSRHKFASHSKPVASKIPAFRKRKASHQGHVIFALTEELMHCRDDDPFNSNDIDISNSDDEECFHHGHCIKEECSLTAIAMRHVFTSKRRSSTGMVRSMKFACFGELDKATSTATTQS